MAEFRPCQPLPLHCGGGSREQQEVEGHVYLPWELTALPTPHVFPNVYEYWRNNWLLLQNDKIISTGRQGNECNIEKETLSLLLVRLHLFTPKGQLSIERTIENLGRFLWSQFWLDVHKILTQNVNMYALSGIFFRSGA